MKLCSTLLLLVIYYVSFSQGNNLNSYGEKTWELNLVGLQENDKETIYRPCHLRDLNCIRKFFADNSQCSITKGPAPDPLILERNIIYLPFVNVTIIFHNMQISGLNSAKVRELYLNKDTGNVVFAIDVTGLSERSTYTTFRYRRTGKEPVVLTDYTTATYPIITYTVVIPKVPNLQLDKADIHPFIGDTNPPFIVGEKAYNSTDPQVQKSFNLLTNALPIALREAFLLKTSIYVKAFIQSNICNFGLKDVSV